MATYACIERLEDVDVSDIFVGMEIYHQDLRQLAGVFITGCLSTVGATSYVTVVQLNGT